MSLCQSCPRKCNVDREGGERGYCGASATVRIARSALHLWEEPIISGTRGSGTIFFSGCNLRCVFCQNYAVSHGGKGRELTVEELCERMLDLQRQGAHNINLVTPTHYATAIVEALRRVRKQLYIPVVYNTSSYEKVDTLKRIDPYIDIYLPDIKFYSPALSKRYLGKEDYFDIASEAVRFMANSKPLVMTDEGKMLSGCIVRHLVMPLCIGDTKSIIKWFASELPNTTYLSLMSQYTPFGEIAGMPELSRSITAREYNGAVQTAFDLGITNLFLQERDSSGKSYIPKWDF